MATIKEIYEEINEEVTTDLELGATSTSKVAEFRLLKYVVTSISSVLQGLWDIFKVDLNDAADAVPTCNDAWWNRELRKFQYEHNLLLDNITKKYYYAEDDLDAQIVSLIAITDQNGKGVIKVAEAGPVPLDVDKKAALNSYIKKIQPLGSNIVLISQAADLIKLLLNVHYDPIVPLATVKTNVEQAINTYLSSLQFNVGKTGTFYITYLIDAIQAVEGVVDVTVNEISAKQDGAASFATVLRKYVPVAGQIAVDGATPLSGSITYISEL